MEYTKTYNELKKIFVTEVENIIIPGSDVRIHNIPFTSDLLPEGILNERDQLITENNSFTYPVFSPHDIKSNKVILLLHGLNERSWVKYLTWAFWLAEYTGSYVILFPISFHINRSPAAWRDPRVMIPLMKEKTEGHSEICMASFANIALSNRLTENPQRFFNSGYQTAMDIIKLISSVRKGSHPVIPKSSKVNVFAYSIGAFLAEIMFMGNPENIFSRSKLFIFCGGSVFSNMNGSSKLIMDSRAFERVYKYYLFEFEKSIKEKSPMAEFLGTSQIGMAFRSMIDLDRFKNFRESLLTKLRNQIHSVALAKDLVIPARGVVATLNTLSNNGVAEVWDFPYAYCHENPFPVFATPLSKDVDRCFEKVFSTAREFLR